jgi:glycosyltransferase involved in cell wall biosynthesis
MNKVLIDCERTRYPNTGLFQFCKQLGNSLIAQYDPQVEELHFYLPKEQRNLFNNYKGQVIQHSIHKFIKPNTAEFQVYHSTYQNSNYQPFNSKTRVVLTVHDLNFLVEPIESSGKIKKWMQHVQKNINRADHLVFISEYSKKHVSEFIDLTNKPCSIIYNGCTINEFSQFDHPAYFPQKPFLFAIGTVMPKKNFHVLTSLLQNNNYELLIAGRIDKDYATRIMKEANKNGVENRVQILGAISEEEKYWYYKHCLAFTIPSITEGFGLPLVEAMYYGKPSFVTGKTALPEIGGSLAYYFENFEPAHMQQVFENGMKDFNERHPEEAIHNRAMEFSWENAGRDYLKIYRSFYHS